MLDDSITSRHFAISSRISFSNAAGVEGSASMPWLLSLLRKSAAFSPLFIAWLILAMMALDV